MHSVGLMPVDRERLKERAFERRWARAGKDLCDLISPTFVNGGASGDSVDLNPGTANLECIITELSAAGAQTVVGGTAYLSSHGLEMKKTAATLAITPGYKIRAHARDGKAERFFENPVGVEQSFAALVTLKAAFVRQGYQQ